MTPSYYFLMCIKIIFEGVKRYFEQGENIFKSIITFFFTFVLYVEPFKPIKMAILFKSSKVNYRGISADTNEKYIARCANKKRVNLDYISASIASKCSLRKADVYGVIVALTEEIPDLLLENNTVDLGNLGIFSLHLTSHTETTPEAVNAASIKQVKIAFRPGKQIKQQLKLATFKKTV